MASTNGVTNKLLHIADDVEDDCLEDFVGEDEEEVLILQIFLCIKSNLTIIRLWGLPIFFFIFG